MGPSDRTTFLRTRCASQRYQNLPGSHVQWENKAAFDPTFRWTYRQESKARRKCDWIILLWISIMFFSLDLAGCSRCASSLLTDEFRIVVTWPMRRPTTS